MGYPRSVVRWYLNGKEILPSKDFVIDNLEDGTSILSISEVFPDDIGELMCEAQNENGIATTTTQLNMIGQLICSIISFNNFLNLQLSNNSLFKLIKITTKHDLITRLCVLYFII